MKKGFTLIEIMIATIIVFIASFAILNVSNNSKHLFSLITKNNDFTLKASIYALNQKKGNLYENLIDFNITNDEIIKELKKYKYNLKITKNIQELKEFNLKEEIDTIKIYNKTNQMEVYQVSIE